MKWDAVTLDQISWQSQSKGCWNEVTVMISCDNATDMPSKTELTYPISGMIGGHKFVGVAQNFAAWAEYPKTIEETLSINSPEAFLKAEMVLVLDVELSEMPEVINTANSVEPIALIANVYEPED